MELAPLQKMLSEVGEQLKKIDRPEIKKSLDLVDRMKKKLTVREMKLQQIKNMASRVEARQDQGEKPSS